MPDNKDNLQPVVPFENILEDRTTVHYKYSPVWLALGPFAIQTSGGLAAALATRIKGSADGHGSDAVKAYFRAAALCILDYTGREVDDTTRVYQEKLKTQSRIDGANHA